MKVLAIQSSPRKNGNSNTMVEQFSSHAEENGHEIIEYNLDEMVFRGCRACRVCKETGKFCILDDDLATYWAELADADVLVIGSPNYMGDICGTLKLFIDRHYCTKDQEMKTKLNKEKQVILCMSQGKKDAAFYEDNYNIYKRYFGTHGFETKIVTHSGHHHVREDSALLNEIKELSNNIF